MADLVRDKTEIECLISDFENAGEVGQERRKQVAEEVKELERKIEDANERMDELGPELDEAVNEERDAREA
jgi:structural maintenance of chromosome 3 (chondroitin sulfate proteoglycan 6)